MRLYKLKLDLYDKTTYKYTQEKNLVSNQYTLFDSSRFSHSDCGSDCDVSKPRRQN